jgi:hypothetical protein
MSMRAVMALAAAGLAAVSSDSPDAVSSSVTRPKMSAS